MDNTKKTEQVFNKARDDIAGPGQNPTIPHPMPNVPEPTIKFLSIDFREGIVKLSANKGLFLLLNKKNTGALIIIAPIITKIKEGSHRPNMSRNPKTFSGLIMLEKDKTNPKLFH